MNRAHRYSLSVVTWTRSSANTGHRKTTCYDVPYLRRCTSTKLSDGANAVTVEIVQLYNLVAQSGRNPDLNL